MNEKVWTVMNSTDGEGRLAIVLCWYSDNEDYRTSRQRWRAIAKLIGKLPSIAKMDWSVIDGEELWYVYDALGSYPERDDFLDAIYRSSDQEYTKRLMHTKTS